jgi:hypothetical protein
VQGVLTVAVLTSNGTAGDALDDAFFVWGPERSQSLLNRYAGTEVYFFLPESKQASPERRWRMMHQAAASAAGELSQSQSREPGAGRHLARGSVTSDARSRDV